jgi:hypothetical protein
MSRSIRLASTGLVAAAVLAIAACGTSTSSGGVAGATGTPATSAAPPSAAPPSVEASASAAESAPALNQAVLQFQEQNDSGIIGGAILTDLGENQTAVTIGVVAAGVTEPMPANVLPNDCASAATASPPPPASAAPSAAASPAASGSAAPLDPTTILRLGDLTAGSSNTVLALVLDDLLSTPHAVVIYRSAADPTIVACADITR